MTADLNRNSLDGLHGVIVGVNKLTGEAGAVIETDRRHLSETLEKLKKQKTQVVGAGTVIYESMLDSYLWDFSHLG